MSGFQVGDVVVCVDDSIFVCAGRCRHQGIASPRKGMVSRVEGFRASIMETGPGAGTACGCINLVGAGWWGNSLRFRKIRPASEEFIVALRACKPERIGQPA